MKEYERVTWSDLNKNGHISPIAGLDAVTTTQVAEYFGVTQSQLNAERARYKKKLDQLGVGACTFKQVAEMVKHATRTSDNEYSVRCEDGTKLQVPAGKITYYTAPAVALVADALAQRKQKADDMRVAKINPDISNIPGLMEIDGIECYERDGTVYLKLETVARGLGFTREKGGIQYVMWDRVARYLDKIGFPHKCEKTQTIENTDLPAFIPENIFYRLAMKAKNEVAEAFQAKIADEVIPAIRRHGAYMTPDVLEEALSNPDYAIRVLTKLKEERDARLAAEQRNAAMEKENQALAKQEQTWTDKDVVTRLVRVYGRNVYYDRYGVKEYAYGWNAFMNELLYKYGINLRARGEQPYINNARPDEMPKLLAVAAAMCRRVGVDVMSRVNSTNYDEYLKDEAMAC